MSADPAVDQAYAAVAEARTAMATALGLPDTRPSRGHSPFLDELLTVHLRPETPRCSHLAARPVQVWMMILPYPGWRCRPCAVEFARSRRGQWLGDVEEYTCDRCRRYLPSERLTVAILRQDMWIVHASLCRRCVETGKTYGARELIPGPQNRCDTKGSR